MTIALFSVTIEKKESEVGEKEPGLDPQIEKLSDKWAREPTSLVFAPLADAYRRSNLLDEAIQVLEKGLEKHPNYLSARLILGRCYRDKRMFELARQEFDRVLSSDPQNLVALRLKGDVSVPLGQKDVAIENYQRLLELQPTNQEVRDILADLGPAEPVQEVPPPEPAPIGPEPETAEPRPEMGEPTPEGHLADFFDMPPGLSDTEDPSAPEAATTGQPRELQSAFDPHAILSEAEPVDDLHSSPNKLSETSPSSEEKGPGFAEFLKPAGAEEQRTEPPSGETTVPELTLAEIYEDQGFKEKALEAYQQMLLEDPDNMEIKAKVAELSRELGREGGSPTEKPSEEPIAQPPDEPAHQEVSLDDLFKEGTEETQSGPPPSEETKGEPPSEEKKEEDLQGFQSWLEGLKED